MGLERAERVLKLQVLERERVWLKLKCWSCVVIVLGMETFDQHVINSAVECPERPMCVCVMMLVSHFMACSM